MEKLFALCKLGINYLYRYRRRYIFLFAALTFGFTVVTFITSSKDSMYDNVYYSAQSHYAGDIVAVGYNSRYGGRIHFLGENEISAVLDAAKESGINIKHTLLRTLLTEKGVIYFNGNAVVQKYVVGCDWEEEQYLFSKMEFEAPLNESAAEDTIILSSPVASRLGAAVGDSVILEVETVRGQKNTGVFIVNGIVKDASLFGYYKAYVSRKTLNRLLLFNENVCSLAGFFLDKPSVAEKSRRLLHEVLSEKMQTGSLVYNREEMDREVDWSWSGIKVFLFTMPVFLSDVSNLLEAMNIITYFLYGMMLIIIFVSAAVTYRLIIHERAREIGVMRSIGFYGADIRLVLWTEVTALGVISLFAGFILARLLSYAASFLSFSWFPSFEIFLKGGKFSSLYLPETILFNVVLIIFILAAAVVFPSFRASQKRLPSLLSGEPL
jgi:ABC-type lipoprotein release transport system permease subunit